MKKTTLMLAALALPMTTCALVAQDASPAPAKASQGKMMKHDAHMERHMDGPGGPGGGFGMGPGGMPPGTWWKSTEMAQKIGLSADQVKRIDDIFVKSRVELIHAHAALEEQELMLEPLMSANPIDQGKALSQINKIADLRADLEKTNAKMLLGIRGVLSADQWTKLQTMHHGFGRHDAMRGHDGPDQRRPGQRPDGPEQRRPGQRPDGPPAGGPSPE